MGDTDLDTGDGIVGDPVTVVDFTDGIVIAVGIGDHRVQGSPFGHIVGVTQRIFVGLAVIFGMAFDFTPVIRELDGMRTGIVLQADQPVFLVNIGIDVSPRENIHGSALDLGTLIADGNLESLVCVSSAGVPQPGFVGIGQPVIVGGQHQRAVVVFQADAETVVTIVVISLATEDIAAITMMGILAKRLAGAEAETCPARAIVADGVGQFF